MAPQHAGDLLRVDSVGGRTVVRFTREVVLTGPQAEAVGEDLARLVGETGPGRLVLDFGNVRSLTSLMLSKLVRLEQAARAAGGELALCNLRPDVQAIFEVTRLTQVLRIYPGEADALPGR
jgi:anti-anti-sigma factor